MSVLGAVGVVSEGIREESTLMRALIELIVWLLPASATKNRVLRIFGHTIAPTATIGPCLVTSLKRADLADGASIGAFTTIRGLSLLKMGKDAGIGSFNWISAHPLYQEHFDGAGTLGMRDGAVMTSRHYIDCSGTVELGYFTVIGGHRTTILTHEANIHEPVQNVGRVSLGARSALLTNCVLLTGTHLPPRSIVAAQATLLAKSTAAGRQGLYAGTPAKWISEIDSGPGTSLGRTEKDLSEARQLESLGISDDPALDDHEIPTRVANAGDFAHGKPCA
ncbi:acyltransferase [Gordonia sp. NPDC003429]